MRRSLQQIKSENRDLVIVRKTNDLIEARYKMTMWEVRVWDKFLSLLRHEREVKDEYKVFINEIIRNYHLEGDKRAFQRIIQASHSLQDRYITDSAISRDEMRHLRSHVFASIEVVITRDGDSYILFEVPKKLKPILKANRERYKDFLLDNFIGMSSFYSKRLYEILKQYEFIGHRDIALEDLRHVLAIEPEEYKLYAHFKKRVVEKAQEDCARCSDIRFDFEEIRKGKAVHTLRFTIRSNRPTRLLNPPPPVGSRRVAKQKMVLGLPSFEEQRDLFSQAEVVETTLHLPQNEPKNPLFTTFFTRLNEWWGVEDEEFSRRLDGKTEADIEAAIAFTKERIRAGKAYNPAGVFLDALKKGHRSAAQIREEKQAEIKRRADEKQSNLKQLVAVYEGLLDDYSASVNDAVRLITTEHPAVTEAVIEEIRIAQRLLGNRKIDDFTIEHFRKDPMLRGMVIAAIMGKHPARFEALRAAIGAKIEAVKMEIRAIEPAFRFS